MAASTDGGRSEETTKGPVLLFPFLAQGHLIPFLHFARLLHSRSPDLPLIFVSTPPNAHLLRSSPLLPPTLRLAELLLLQQWLDRHPRRSVLYVCFGSQNSLSVAQMLELAAGLEESGRPFVWVIRAPTGHVPGETTIDPRWLPAGFEQRVGEAGRGLLVAKWAPQAAILAHESTGAFLSHCGWNSLLEAVAGGVAVLGWPLAAEQFYNAQLVEGAMGVGWEVGRGAGRVVKAGVVAAAVREALGGERGEAARGRAAELRATLRAEIGGAAVDAVDELLRTVVNRRR